MRFFKGLFCTALTLLLVSASVASADSPASFAPLSGWTFDDITRSTDREQPGLLLDGGTVTYSSPAVADLDGDTSNGLEVAIAGEDGQLYAYRASGELLWEATLPSAECSSGRGNKTLSSPAIGDLDGDGVPSVVIGYGGISSAGCDGGVAAYNGVSGTLEWKFSIKAFASSQKYGTRSYTVFSTPALADTDHDGKLEIGFGSFDRNVYLLEYDGQVRWYYNAADTVWSSAAFADINNDGILEMIIGTDITGNRQLRPITRNGGYVYAFKTARRSSKRIGFRDKSAYYWQQTFDQVIFSSPVVADVIADNAGDEVIVASGCYFPERTDNKSGKWVKVLSARSGKILRTLPIDACSPSSVAVGDIDEDGALEIVASVNGHKKVGGSGRSTLVAFEPETGAELWNIIPRERGGNDAYGGHFTSPTIADLDHNGSLEVILANRAAVGIFAGKDGSALSCQEKDCDPDQFVAYTASTLRGTPAIADIDGDGAFELVMGGGNASYRGRGFLYAWTDFETDLGSESGLLDPGTAPWSCARGSAARTGAYSD